MKKLNILLIAFLAISFSLVSCDKNNDDDDHDHEGTGTVEMKFDYVWGMSNAAFTMNTDLFHPMTSDTLNVSLFKFYISNVKLKDMDGNWWAEEESYHLVNASTASSNTITLSGVPAAHYTELSYTIGVDSARNVSGSQTGALDPANDMFWSWNSGYIMMKIEGTKVGGGSFSYHLGGFSGANNVVSVKSTDFGGSHLMLDADATKTINLSANPAKFWHGTGGVDSLPAMIHMPNATATEMASNFTGSFQFVSVE
ncbi:MAG: MbnP family protein [Chitinophagales bacterium]|nr:hypothetical protein [Bacteroidota bacterium]MCB9226762.1 hypothetical protein [Chitinophagales bacterium]